MQGYDETGLHFTGDTDEQIVGPINVHEILPTLLNDIVSKNATAYIHLFAYKMGTVLDPKSAEYDRKELIYRRYPVIHYLPLVDNTELERAFTDIDATLLGMSETDRNKIKDEAFSLLAQKAYVKPWSPLWASVVDLKYLVSRTLTEEDISLLSEKQQQHHPQQLQTMIVRREKGYHEPVFIFEGSLVLPTL